MAWIEKTHKKTTKEINSTQTQFVTFEDSVKAKKIAKDLVLAKEQLKQIGYDVIDYDLSEYPQKLYIQLQKTNGIKFWIWV
jgi:hypothetical protein